MDDDSTEDEAETWAVAMLECAFKKPNPSKPLPYSVRKLGDPPWTPEVRQSPSEHPYRPKVLGAKEVEQPRPRR